LATPDVPPPGSPTVRRRRLAGELRRIREHIGLNGDDVAERLGWSASKVSRIENARQTPRLGDVRRLLDLYSVEQPYRDQLLELARDAARKGWWEEYSGRLPEVYPVYIGLEVEAEAVWQYAVEVIPGLLQTEEYARGVIQPWQPIGAVPPSQIEARIEARLARQKVLTRRPPLQFNVVLDETVLLRRYGDPSAMRAQPEHLARLGAELPNLALQVLHSTGPIRSRRGHSRFCSSRRSVESNSMTSSTSST